MQQTSSFNAVRDVQCAPVPVILRGTAHVTFGDQGRGLVAGDGVGALCPWQRVLEGVEEVEEGPAQDSGVVQPNQ